MGNYGEPILDKKDNLIGYKINETEYASVEIYYNDNNLLCNKISIKEFDENILTFKNDTMIFWVDIQTEFGFVREFDNNKYYYDKNNKLFNVEVKFNQLNFPTYKKNLKLNNKIGTLDF